jgi:CheY-like chemotaxis protein
MNEKIGANHSILVVEDEPILGRVCSRILTLNGYSVTLVTNGLIAKDQVEKNHFDFCLSDIKTPVMNGMELYKFLKENYPELAAKTVFMTGDVMSKDIEKFLEESNAPYILKPFTDIELIGAVSKRLK